MMATKPTNFSPGPRPANDDPLGLGDLPLLDPPRDGWAEIEAALRERPARGRALRAGGGLLAVAATAVLAFGLWFAAPPSDRSVPHPGTGAARGETTPAPAEAVPAPLQEPPVEALMAMSRQLEERIRTYRGRAGDLPSDVLVYQVELQDLIVQVDEALSRAPESPQLWARRVNLLLDVDRLYENSLRRDYYRVASL